MQKSSLAAAAAAFIFLAVFIFGVTRIFELRFEAGDIYPPYSTLRTDPLGISAYYEGLAHIGKVQAERSLVPMDRIKDAPGRTFILAGMDSPAIGTCGPDPLLPVETLAGAGARVVIAFMPVAEVPEKPESEEAAESGSEGKDKPAGQKDEKPVERKDDKQQPPDKGTCPVKKKPTAAEKLGFGIDYKEIPESGATAVLSPDMKSSSLPKAVSWHSTLYFTFTDPSWKTVYTRDGLPVMIRRKYGRNGEVILSADSYFLSNEAMKKERHAGLLAWLPGTGGIIFFDETHLGIEKSPGIASLVRKHSLMPFIASLIGLALLFIWRNSTSLVPARGDVSGEGIDWGKDSFAALANLYKRNIRPSEIIEVCISQWKQSFSHGRKSLKHLLPQMRKISESGAPASKGAYNPLRIYSEISRLVLKETSQSVHGYSKRRR